MFRELEMKEMVDVNGGDVVSVVVSGFVASATVPFGPGVQGAATAVATGLTYEYMESLPRVDYNDTNVTRGMYNNGYWRKN